MNASEDLPQEVFNGNEYKKEYEHLAIPKKNFIDQDILEVFRVRLEGLWMCDNLKKVLSSLKERFPEDKFDIEFTVHKYSPSYKECS